jgi:antitoxin component YwqK of YwqJK toxin-antitoxin module
MLKYFKILVIIFPFFTFAQNLIKQENLSKKDIIYWDFNKTKVQATGSYYVDFLGGGKDKHGKWMYYDKFGVLEEERNYYRGKLHGKVAMFFSNGKPKQEGYFKMDKQDSIYREWNETGLLAKEGLYNLDRPKGIWKNYYLDGREKSYEEEIDSITYIRAFWLPDPKHTQTIIDGTGEMTVFYTTGAVKEWYNYKNGRPDGLFEERSVYGYNVLTGAFKEGEKEGEWKYYYYTGSIEKTSFYKNGVLNGPYNYYYDKGQLNVSGNYLDGKKDGLWKWYTNTGSPDMQGSFLKDLQEGEWVYWYPTGEKSYTAHYSKGLKTGHWVYLNKDGSTFKVGDFVNDLKEGKWQTWYEDGTLLMDGTYSKGKEEGIWLNYWDNGKLKNSVAFKHGEMHGVWKSFSITGHPKLTGKYKKNYKVGEWTSYYENGSPKDIISYKVKEVKSEMNYGLMKGHKVRESVQHGRSVSFSSKDFKKTEEGNYKDGKKDGEWFDYYPGGKIPAVFTTYKNGELNGPMRQYSRMGKINSEINYSNGVKHGKFIIYGENGKIINQKNFVNGIEER